MLTRTLLRVIKALSTDTNLMDKDIRSIEELHADCAYVLLDDTAYCIKVANEPPVIIAITDWVDV